MNKGHNQPPVELTGDEAAFVVSLLERDLGQSLSLLQLVQEGKMSKEAAYEVVSYIEKAKPILKRLKDQL